MKTMRSVFNWALILTCMLIFMSSNALAISFKIINGDTNVAVDQFANPQTAADYYNYYATSGHPAFGPEARTGFFWLFEDTRTGDLSLSMIFSKQPAPGEPLSSIGGAALSISGLMDDAFVAVKDDPTDRFSTLNDPWVFSFGWNAKNTDGAVIGGLNDFALDDVVTISLLRSSGIDTWYFLSGNATNPDRILLSMNNPLVIYDPPTEAPPSPTPEPSTLFLVGSGLLGLGTLKKRLIG